MLSPALPFKERENIQFSYNCGRVTARKAYKSHESHRHRRKSSFRTDFSGVSHDTRTWMTRAGVLRSLRFHLVIQMRLFGLEMRPERRDVWAKDEKKGRGARERTRAFASHGFASMSVVGGRPNSVPGCAFWTLPLFREEFTCDRKRWGSEIPSETKSTIARQSLSANPSGNTVILALPLNRPRSHVVALVYIVASSSDPGLNPFFILAYEHVHPVN